MSNHSELDPDLIRMLRERIRMTQVQFASLLLVHPITVSRWERGIRAPSRVHVKQMRDKWGGAFTVLRERK